jgi:sulfotransferase family protein
VPQVREPTRFAPLFVLASGRSCSSVITSMIGCHPQLYGLPELKLFLFPTVGELDASLPDGARRRGFAHRSPGLVRAVAELEFGSQSRAALCDALVWLQERRHWLGANVLDHLMRHVEPLVAVEKSPEHVDDPRTLARVVHAYPRARYIHLVRHPAPTIHSMNQHLKRSYPGRGEVDFVAHCAQSWVSSNETIISTTRGLPPERRLLIKAEDLLNDPVPHLSAVAVWLGLRADDAAIEAMLHPERSPFASFAPSESGVSGGNDPTFLASPQPHAIESPANLKDVDELSDDPRAREAIRRLATAFGYL